jgi:hypothetical protein
MINWFKSLMALLAGRNRTRTPWRTDWRGRPMGENTGGAISPVRRPGGDRYSTLGLPPSAGADARQGEQARGAGDA